jgi:hypothetical protein
MNPWLERLQQARRQHPHTPAGSVGVGRAEDITAVKVWSPVVNATVWVVADDLPREAWPTDAPVYTQAEVTMLRQSARDWLAWVHASKALFDARVIDAPRVKNQNIEEGQGPRPGAPAPQRPRWWHGGLDDR